MTAGSRVDEAGLRQLVPHQGAMCLLHSVESWSDTGLRATAISHRDAAHPLRSGNHLRWPAIIEYAAQAAAVHGGLRWAQSTGGHRPRPGFIASVRAVRATVEHLEALPSPLVLDVERQAGEGSTAGYAFTASAAGRAVATGRLTVVLDTPLQP